VFNIKKYLIFIIFLIIGCAKHVYIDRLTTIPLDQEKMTPEMDLHPPILHSDEFETPVPVAVISSAGAEDSPFIPIDRDEMYLFFTPDVRVPVEKQVIDGVTGMYLSKFKNGGWTEPERVFLQDPGKLSLDGCGFIRGNDMLFCTVREGYTGIHWATAKFKDGEWINYKINDFDPEYEVGELHIHDNELYYHSKKQGGKGDNDIWMLTFVDGEWKNPVNIENVNSEVSDGWPYISPDGNEL
jgi:hypothetical protein